MTMDHEKDIVYSQAIKAGKRIYYIDVKRNRRDELFLAITESKKIVQGEGPDAPFTLEKHKIFLYPEDFSKFIDGLSKAVGYIHQSQPMGPRYDIAGEAASIAPIETSDETPLDEELKIDIDFE